MTEGAGAPYVVEVWSHAAGLKYHGTIQRDLGRADLADGWWKSAKLVVCGTRFSKSWNQVFLRFWTQALKVLELGFLSSGTMKISRLRKKQVFQVLDPKSGTDATFEPMCPAVDLVGDSLSPLRL